jgi:hypothetical protein
MVGLRCIDVQSRPTAFLDVTSLTLDEFQQLVRARSQGAGIRTEQSR